MVRRMIGAALVLLGVWLCYQVSMALSAYVVRGVPLGTAIADPAFLMRIIGSVGAVLGGLLAAFSRPGGLWFTLVGLVAFTVLTVAIVASGGDQTIWFDEAIISGVLGLLFVGLIAVRRTR